MFDRKHAFIFRQKSSPKLTLWPCSRPYLARTASWLFIKEAQNFLKSKVAAKRTQCTVSRLFLWPKLVPFESLGCFCAAGKSCSPSPALGQSSLKRLTALFCGLSLSCELMKVTKGKGEFVSQNGYQGPPNWSRHLFPFTPPVDIVLGDYRPDISEKDILIQTILSYRKSNPTRLGSIAQMVKKLNK